MKKAVWFLLLVMFAIPLSAVADSKEDIYNTLEAKQKVQLAKIKVQLDYLKDLQKQKVLAAAQVKAQRNKLLNAAQLVMGKKLQEEAVIGVFSRVKDKFIRTGPSAWDSFAGAITLVNIFLFIGAILLVLGIVLLLLFFQIPGMLYEVFFYSGSLVVFFYAQYYVAPHLTPWIAVLGCAGLTGSLVYTNILHELSIGLKWNAAIVALFWAIPALMFNSPAMGFVSMFPLGFFLAHTFVMVPFERLIGGEDVRRGEDSTLAKCIGVSFLFLGFYLFIEGFDIALPGFNVFATGLLYLGTSVFSVSQLILASRWMTGYGESGFLLYQVMAVVAAIGFIYMGSVLDISVLQEAGGTFLMLYLLQKFIEVFSFDSLASMGGCFLGVGLMLYLSSIFIKAYPAYFLLGV